MFTVLTMFFLILGIVLFMCNAFGKYDYEYDIWWCRGTFAIISILITVGLFVPLMIFIPKIATENIYDTRIEIVQESNLQLEEQICSAVEKYLEHEENVYEKLDITTAIGLFNVYPNLKSNELVKTLIDTYKANAEEIKELKLEKTNLTIYKFLVYFGH